MSKGEPWCPGIIIMVDGSRHSLQATGWALNEAVAWLGSFTVLSVGDEGADNGCFMPSGGWQSPRHGVEWCRWRGRFMGQAARFRETLRRLAMIDERFVEDEARLGLGSGERWL